MSKLVLPYSKPVPKPKIPNMTLWESAFLAPLRKQRSKDEWCGAAAAALVCGKEAINSCTLLVVVSPLAWTTSPKRLNFGWPCVNTTRRRSRDFVKMLRVNRPEARKLEDCAKQLNKGRWGVTPLTHTRWYRDLTEEGIHPHPGPSVLHGFFVNTGGLTGTLQSHSARRWVWSLAWYFRFRRMPCQWERTKGSHCSLAAQRLPSLDPRCWAQTQQKQCGIFPKVACV